MKSSKKSFKNTRNVYDFIGYKLFVLIDSCLWETVSAVFGDIREIAHGSISVYVDYYNHFNLENIVKMS